MPPTARSCHRPTATTPPRFWEAASGRSRSAPRCARWPCRATSTRSRHRRLRPRRTARHAISVIKSVNGDAVRRTVVDANKCAGCHEWFEGHGGNRVYETQVCVACHVPGLASSGRGMPTACSTPWKFNALALDDEDPDGLEFRQDRSANAALNFPVTSNNFKDMIHGIHAGRDRETPRRSRTRVTQPAAARSSCSTSGGWTSLASSTTARLAT